MLSATTKVPIKATIVSAARCVPNERANIGYPRQIILGMILTDKRPGDASVAIDPTNAYRAVGPSRSVTRQGQLDLLNVRLLARFAFGEFIQPADHVAQEQFVLQVHLIIEISPQPILLRLAVLRHHNDWSL